MNEVPALLLIMGIWFGMVGLCFLAYRSGRKRHEELALHAPLHPESTVHRMDAALSQAEEGFNECSGCGFQNFKRSIFCQLCGETIDSPLRDPIESKKSKKGRGSSTTTALSSPRSEIVSVTNVARQHRAKKRREWVRELNAGGDLVWRREAQVEQDEAVALFPSYVLRFIPTDVITAGIDAVQIKIVDNKAAPESCASDTACDVTSDEEPEDVQEKPEHEQAEVKGPIRGTYDERVAEIKQMCESVRLELHDACIADAAVFPIAVESTLDPEQVGGDVKTFHERFQRDFPTKLASFVKTTTNIFVPPDKLHMKMHLDRETVVGDSMKLLGLIQQKDVRVAFRIDFVKEKAVDAGGVYREWFLLLNEGLVKKEKGIFRCVDQTEQTYYLNPNSAHDIGEDHLLYFLATGRLIGRSLLEGNATGFHLSLPLLKLILGLPLSFSDLEFFDPAAYKNMKWLLENDGVEALCLDFTVTEQVDGTMVDVELIPNGGNIPVTDDNKLEYVDRLFRYRLFESVQPQLYAFLRGVYEVIPAELLMMFDPEELDLVLCGADEIDVDDWERNTKYTSDLYKHPCLKWFWEIVREMPNEYRRRLLQFATGSSRVPLSGFSTLTSYDGRLCPFTLKGVALSDEGYIRSHACFNRLDLPRHTDKEKLKVILYAILNTEQHGFTTS